MIIYREPPKARRKSTPLSEVKRQAWAMLLGEDKDPTSDEIKSVNKKLRLEDSELEDLHSQEENKAPENVTPNKREETESQKLENIQVTNQLKLLQNMMKSNENSGGRRSLLKLENNTPQRTHLSHIQQTTLFHDSHKDSQPDTVGWDDPIEPIPTQPSQNNLESESFEQPRKFMFSGVSPDQKIEFETIVSSLGSTSSDSPNFDITATHLLCPTPSRNEKFLSSMASGKFILHPTYLTDSKAAGKFLDEELYQYGNPKFLSKIQVQAKSNTNLSALFKWKKKISEEKHGAFYKMRIVLFSSNKLALTRLIEAGEGVIVNAR